MPALKRDDAIQRFGAGVDAEDLSLVAVTGFESKQTAQMQVFVVTGVHRHFEFSLIEPVAFFCDCTGNTLLQPP